MACGPLSYRVTIECKLGRDDGISRSDAVAEAPKYVQPYHADYAMLVAPSFDAEVTFVSELQTHRVAAWTVDDLSRAATLGLDAYRLRDLLAAGYAEDRRLAQQGIAHSLGNGSQSPRLSIDVGMAMIDAKTRRALQLRRRNAPRS